MIAKPPPYKQIGALLSEGLVAFESAVANFEQLCLTSVPRHLRDVIPMESNGEVSPTWRESLAPDLPKLQQKTEEIEGRLIVLMLNFV